MGKACTFYFILTALAILAQQYECSDLEPQIKMVRAQIWFVNPTYVNALWYNVHRHNQTYNDMGLHWEVIKDLPEDIKVNTSVYVTNSTFGDEKLILQDVTYLCKEDKHRNLLPKLILLNKFPVAGKCIKQGVYDMNDMGQYRYEELVPDIEKLGKYYKSDSVVGNDNETVLIVTFYSTWGYLNDTRSEN